MKKISIICCLYNTDPNLFNKTLKSIQNQTFKDFNVYILNDGSTKNLEENKNLINKLNDNRFIFIDLEHQGKSQMLNYGILNSYEKYICICDSDDIMYNHRLEYQYNFLESHEEYEYLSNAVLTSDKQVFPNSYDISQEITLSTVGYLGNHNCCMFRRDIINKVPFLFQQYYNYIEDLVFNYHLFVHGIKMYYDNTILQEYTFNILNSSHRIGLEPYYKESSYKIQLNTYKNNNDGEITCLLICNNWGVELEKTILSIRTTSNQVKIIILDISTDDFDYYSVADLYSCEYYKFDNYNFYTLLNEYIMNIEDENLLFIGEPCRFYNQNWDIYLMRLKNDFFNNDLIFPNLVKIDKINDNFYENEEKWEMNKKLYSNKLNLLSLDIEKKLDNYIINNEYSNYEKCFVFPKMIFFIPKSVLYNINGLLPFNCEHLQELFLSLKLKLCGYNVILDKDFNVGYINDTNESNVENKTDKFEYYKSLYYFVNFFFNETIYVYENLILKKIGEENFNNIKNTLDKDDLFSIYRKFFNNDKCVKNISDLLRNV